MKKIIYGISNYKMAIENNYLIEKFDYWVKRWSRVYFSITTPKSQIEFRMY